MREEECSWLRSSVDFQGIFPGRACALKPCSSEISVNMHVHALTHDFDFIFVKQKSDCGVYEEVDEHTEILLLNLSGR